MKNMEKLKKQKSQNKKCDAVHKKLIKVLLFSCTKGCDINFTDIKDE